MMIKKLFLCVSILLLSNSNILAQKTVTGTVSDATSSFSLLGVSIIEKGTANGTQTDFEGNFSLMVFKDDAILSISHLGYETKEVSVIGTTKITIAEFS